MNAVNPLQVATGPRSSERSPDRQAEPSMEEILASIRRIIADDQAAPVVEPPAPPAAVEAQASPLSAPSSPAPSPLRATLRARSFAEPQAAEQASDGLAGYGQVLAPQFPSPEGLAREGDADPPPPASSPPRAGSASGLNPGSATALASPPSRREDTPSPPHQDTAMRDQLARDAGYGQGRDLPAEASPRPSGLFSATTDQSLSAAFNMLAATRLADDSDELRAMAREMIRPLLKTWLDDNLPSLVERLVRAEIERVARGGR